MGKRIIVAAIMVPILLAVIYGPYPILLPIMISALSMVAVHEALWSTSFLQHPRISGYSILLAGVIPFWVAYDGRPLPALCGLFIYVVLLFAEAISSHKSVGLEKMGGAFFLSVMIPFFLSSFLRIQHMEYGQLYIMMPFVAAFLSDVCALFSGMLFGKHKLAPELSPKKTVEGAVGGFIGAILCMLLYGVILQLLCPPAAVSIHYCSLAVYGALGSVLAQLGDLSFSYIKREYGIKDFGNIFPGHGGVLDRFDSVIFCAPLMELLILILPAIGGSK